MKQWVAVVLLLCSSLAAVGADSLSETRRKAEQGDAAAQFNLGWIYASGDGVPSDPSEAVKWWRKSAEQGNDLAQNFLGIAHANGEGVLKDSVEAVKWYRKSAEQGNATSQNQFGLMYYNGDGVLKDIVQAHAWFNLAGASGEEDAKKNLVMAERKMTAEQKTEAMKLAREMFARLEKK